MRNFWELKKVCSIKMRGEERKNMWQFLSPLKCREICIMCVYPGVLEDLINLGGTFFVHIKNLHQKGVSCKGV